MAHLTMPLSDLDVIGIGLAGSWSDIPGWLAEALHGAVRSDPDQLFAASHQRNQVGLLDGALDSLGLGKSLPASIRTRIDDELLAVSIVQDVLIREMETIDKMFSIIGIKATYLKGIASARHYTRLSDRPFNDIDVLVEPDDAFRAYAALVELGFVQGRFDKRCGLFRPGEEIPSLDDPSEYELPKLTRMASVEIRDQSLRARLTSNRIAYDGKELRVPVPAEIHYALEPDRRFPIETRPIELPFLPNGCDLVPEVQLAYLAYKAYTDIILLGARAGIKLVADVVRLIEHSGHSMFWPGMIDRWHQRGLCAPLRHVLGAAREIYRCDVPVEAGSCTCDDADGELGDVANGSPLDLGDFLPFIARGSPRFSFTSSVCIP